jgi:hypothetical protein
MFLKNNFLFKFAGSKTYRISPEEANRGEKVLIYCVNYAPVCT